MKQLTCEVCGSTDLLKQDGFFVCQACGTKYSLEEVKKMMAAAGGVTAANTANVDSLYLLAKTSFDSNNYAKAENFCDQVLSVANQHYDAWFLKAMSIDKQIDADHPRIDEVTTCIQMAYKVCPEEEKAEKVQTLLPWLMGSFKSDIGFWLNQVERKRPSDATVAKAINTRSSLCLKIEKIFPQMGQTQDEIIKWQRILELHFVDTMINVVDSAWDTTVGYNYYRGKYQNGYWTDRDYRPNEEIYRTFRREITCLEDLINNVYDDTLFRNTLPPETVVRLLRQKILFLREFANAQSWKAMVRTTTNGYGAVVNREEYWEQDWGATMEAKTVLYRSIGRFEAEIEDEEEKARKLEAERQEKERQERIANYWLAHADEKRRLELEQEQLRKEIEALESQLSEPESQLVELRKKRSIKRSIKTPLEEARIKQRDLVGSLEMKLSNLGLFSFKEKKALNAQLNDIERPRLEELRAAVHAESTQYQAEIDAQIGAIEQKTQLQRDALAELKKKSAAITEELTRNR